MADARSVAGGLWKQRSDVLVAVGVIVVVMMMLIPLPAVLLDILMAANLVLSLLIILTVLYTRHALEFSVFPTLLLIATVFGLALNVSSTRLILAQGSRFNGHIVRAFATFVVGTKGVEGYVIGLIIFIIIIAVQFIVITKGATRVAEVAARFTLDALPGKQMAIEAEYNSGLITEEEATKKKNDLQREADFYGSMDGASKFISGNVKVGILITVVNIIGGLIVGMTLHGGAVDRGAGHLHIARHRRRPGDAAARPAHLHGDGHHRHPCRLRLAPSARTSRSSSPPRAAVPHRGRIPRAAVLPPRLPLVRAHPDGSPASARSGSEPDPQEGGRGGEEPHARGGGQGARGARGDVPRGAAGSPVPRDRLRADPARGQGAGGGAAGQDHAHPPRVAPSSWASWCRASASSTTCAWSPRSTRSRSGESRWAGAGSRWGTTSPSSPGKAAETLPGEQTKDPAFGLPAVWIVEEDREKAERLGCTVVDPAVDHRHAPHGDHQAVRRRDPRPPGGAVHPGRAEDRLPRRGRGGAQGPRRGRDPEGAPGAARRAGVGAQHGRHPRDPGRLRRGHQGRGLPRREGAPGPGPADLPAVLRREEDPAGAHDRAVAGEGDHRLAPGDQPGHRGGRWTRRCTGAGSRRSRTPCRRCRSRDTTRWCSARRRRGRS